MAILRRILLFAIMNIVIIVTLTLVMELLGVTSYMNSRGLDYNSLLFFSVIWGFGGAFLSLLLSKWSAKWMMGVQTIQPNSREPHEQWLFQTVKRLAERAGLPATPEVGIYRSPQINAFATGATRGSALVAVSDGLLTKMNQDEVEGVLGHEISHIANGDMVTMTLMQGVLNVFVIFFARIIAHIASQSVRDNARPWVRFGLVILFEILFGILATLILNAFSRWREFRADAGSAKLVGRDKMIMALRSLQQTYGLAPSSETAETFSRLQIAPRRGGFMALFATHPSLEDRIARLQSRAV